MKHDMLGVTARLAPLGLMLLLAGTCLADGANLRREAVAGLRSVSLRDGLAEDPLGEGSKLIEGPDCGHAKVVIGKYAKAAKVGHLAGIARGEISSAVAAADSAKISVAKAKDIAKTLGGSEAIDASTTDTEKAATAATTASGVLETALGTFKDKVGSSEFSGGPVEQKDMTDLRKKSEEVATATKLVYEKMDRLAAKVEEASDSAMKDSAKAAKIAKSLITEAKPTITESSDILQKAGWAAEKAETLAGKVEAVLPKIADKATNAKEQAPVWEALKADLEGHKAGVSDAKAKVTSATAPVKAAVTALKDAIKPLEEAAATAAGGMPLTTSISTEISAAEKAQGTADDVLGKLKASVETLKKREDRLESKLEQVDKSMQA